ncbi:MAG TPA: DUF1549 domain-containing protein [Thermoanaerobaculia bacterium]|nr:DUF1549 domain-containing protein [Thermoanaerobaculia bacterium]
MSSQPRSVLFAVLLSLAVPPVQASPIGPTGRDENENSPEIVADTAVSAPSPAGDCAFRGASDPDGVAHRLSASRATVRFASSHPSALAALAAPLSGEKGIVVDPNGYTGVVPRGAKLPHANFVDDEILGKMEKDGITPAPLSSDTEFLRRVTLDLTGRIPDMATVQAFVADKTADKRARQIDLLLASDAFVDRWAQYFDDLFRVTAVPPSGSGRLFPPGRNTWHAYFVDAIRSKKPYDQMARELLTGAGDTYQVGAANFFLRDQQSNGPIQDTYDNQASTTGSVFLGANALFCTSCHNGAGHLDQINVWGSTIKRQDFWGMSAFFAKTNFQRPAGYVPGTQSGEFLVVDNGMRDYSLNTSTGNKSPRVACTATVTTNCNLYPTTPAGITSVTPKYIDGGGTPASGETYRAAMARLLTADPQFAKAAANYFFKELFAVGIVDPPDGFDLLRQDPAAVPPGWSVQPTHPELLVKLGQQFQSSGYDLRAMLRLLTTSSAYQLSSYYPGTWSDAYTPYFARHFVRRLGAEMLFDAITKATGVTLNMAVNGYTNPVTWAVQLPDTAEPGGQNANLREIRAFLDTFLRGNRDDDPRAFDSSISETLYELNSAVVVTNRIKSTASGSTVNKLKSQNASAATIVDTLYLTTLSRTPTDAERTASLALLTNIPSGQTTWTVAEDLQFALLNKVDFLLKY